jgi:hypothetical protein
VLERLPGHMCSCCRGHGVCTRMHRTATCLHGRLLVQWLFFGCRRGGVQRFRQRGTLPRFWRIGKVKWSALPAPSQGCRAASKDNEPD